MRLLSKDATGGWTAYEVFDAVPLCKLALIGAVCLEWNYIEDMVDETVLWATRVDIDMFEAVVSRMQGLEAKFELIKKGARISPIF